MGHNADDFDQDNQPRVPPIGPTIDSLTAQVAELTNMVGYLISFANAIYPKAGQKVLWEDKTTAAGITLEGSSAVATTRGFLLGANFIPTGPGQGTVLFVCRQEGTQVVTVLDSTKVRFVDE